MYQESIDVDIDILGCVKSIPMLVTYRYYPALCERVDRMGGCLSAPEPATVEVVKVEPEMFRAFITNEMWDAIHEELVFGHE